MNNRERLWLWFFPRRCMWCAGASVPDETLCAACADKAGLLLPPELLPETDVPLVTLFAYHSKARRIMMKCKFGGGRNLCHSIGYSMAGALAASHLADKPGWLLCAVPMTPAKLKARGYNQSELIAGAAARWLEKDYAPGLLVKTRETPAQHSLSRAQRQTNVTNVFVAPRPELIRGRKIVLCDDICTTGATLRDAVRALQEAGAARVICLTYLRTESDREEEYDAEQEDFDSL